MYFSFINPGGRTTTSETIGLGFSSLNDKYPLQSNLRPNAHDHANDDGKLGLFEPWTKQSPIDYLA